jgi:hypothetical protein
VRFFSVLNLTIVISLVCAMTVNEWFTSGCNYKQGIALYEALPNCNTNLLKVFKRRETAQNKMKLKYELQKSIVPTIGNDSKKSVEREVVKRKIHININATEKPKEKPSIFLGPQKPKEESKYFRKVFISQLPVELHPLYIQQKSDYNTYCSLKMQLNELSYIKDAFGNIIKDKNGVPKVKPQTPLDIETARVFCMQIETLFDAIDKTWQIIDHYIQTKEVIIIQQKNFTELSPGKVRDKLISVRGSITRQKQRKALLTHKLENAVAKKYKIKYERDLAKCTAKLMQLEQDKIKLIQIRNDEK